MKKAQEINLRKMGLALFWVLISSQILFAQSGSIKGTINENNGNPLPGVSIIIDGTNLGTTSDMSGVFLLHNIPLGVQILKISFVGFETIIKSITIIEGKTLDASFTLKENAFSLQEIVVTASKRSAKIQNVPVSISAISTKGIEEMGINDTKDYLATIPGLYTDSSNPGISTVNIRGVAPLGGWAQTVGYYLGETPMPYLYAASSFDIERIEVLRGPQGTLYGEGSMGGTIKIIPNEANFDNFETKINPEISSTVDGGLNYSFNGMINLPIIKDKLAIRATGFYQNDDGFINNIGLGVDNSNTFNNYGARISARYFVSDRLIISASAIFNKSETDGRFVANKDFETSTSLAESSSNKYNTYTIGADYDFSFANLIVTGSYLKTDFTNVQDLNGLLPTVNYIIGLGGIEPRTGLWTDGIGDEEIYSAEARLVSSGNGPLKWTTGLYFKDYALTSSLLADSDPHIDGNLISGLMEFGFGIPGVTELYDEVYRQAFQQVAMFGEISYDLTPKLNVLAGIRIMKETRSFSDIADGMFPILTSGLIPELRESTGDENVINPKFVISYKPSEKLLMYANASKGFRSGGQNIFQFLYPGSPEFYDSETLWNYEFGLKSTMLDGKLVANAAFYYNDWKDMQVITRSISDLSLTENVAAAHTSGIDTEISWMPIKGLLISAATNYSKAETDVEIKTPAGINPDTGEEIFTTIPEGTKLPNIPEFSYNFAAQYKFVLNNEMSLTPRIDYNHKGSNVDYYVDMLDIIDIPAYNLMNLKLTFENKKLSIYAFAKNLTNEKVLNGYYFPNTELGDLYNIGQPRTIGLGLRVSL